MIRPITQTEINQNKVASLPSRPNASTAFGGAGYTSLQLKQAFDRLPLLLAERYNELVEAITSLGEQGLIANIPTNILDPEGEPYTLNQILQHIKDGTFATYLKIGSSYLDLVLASLAPLDSPAFFGNATAVTPALSDTSGRIATTAWVKEVYKEVFSLFDAVKAGLYGHLPEGGNPDDVLIKTDAASHRTAWVGLKNYAFESPTAHTQAEGDDSQKVATTAFVERKVEKAIAALKGGVNSAYDTLLELAAAIEKNDSDIATALSTIAEKDNKTRYQTFKNGASLDLESATEYRGEGEIRQLELSFPASPKEDFMASLLFTASATENMSYTYSSHLYVTGDDCTDGVFLPQKGIHYTLVFWYGGGKFQGVARRSV